jgi:outer membrane protein OmpA-like peptidoglycan-associated protein
MRVRERKQTMRHGGIAVAMLGLLMALGGCNPVIGAYRNIRGLSQDDPNPATAPNTENLARAEAEPYPNLATVPPPPSGASTAAARERLLRTLTRSRTALEATDRELRAGESIAFAAPPPLPPGMAGMAGNPPAPPSIKGSIKGSIKPDLLGPGPRRPGQPPLPGPLESPLVSPRIAALPQPEAGRPAPPAPHLAAVPAPAPAALPSSAVAAAGFQPAPPPPRLAPLAAALTAPAGKPPPAPAAAIKLAEIRFPADATSLVPGDQSIIAKIAALYHRRPRTLRVVGFAGSGGGARHQLESFRAALDRAQAVAAALGKAGIPAARIKTEAAPAGADSGTARAEILLEP